MLGPGNNYLIEIKFQQKKSLFTHFFLLKKFKVSSILVFIMIPGVGYFYGGMCRRKSQLTLLMSSALSIAVVSFQWFFWGFSFSFSENGGFFFGDFSKYKTHFNYLQSLQIFIKFLDIRYFSLVL